jgi:hypothetical protein
VQHDRRFDGPQRTVVDHDCQMVREFLVVREPPRLAPHVQQSDPVNSILSSNLEVGSRS